MVVLVVSRKALGFEVKHFAGGEHQQIPSRLKKRPDAWRLGVHAVQCAVAVHSPPRKDRGGHAERPAGPALWRTAPASRPVTVARIHSLPSRRRRPDRPPTIQSRAPAFKSRQQSACCVPGPFGFRHLHRRIQQPNQHFSSNPEPTEAHELPEPQTTRRATCAIRHNVPNFHVRRAHVSQRGRGLRGHRLPVLQLRQLLGACRQAEPVVHLLLHCEFLSVFWCWARADTGSSRSSRSQ